MTTEIKKLASFGIIISLLTSTYVTFLATFLKQGFLTENFLSNWARLIPKTYLAVLPFVLITGPLVRRLVEKIFKRTIHQTQNDSGKKNYR